MMPNNDAQLPQSEDNAPKSPPTFAPTESSDVFAMLAYDGPAKTLAEMEAGIVTEAKRRHARALP